MDHDDLQRSLATKLKKDVGVGGCSGPKVNHETWCCHSSDEKGPK